MNKSKLIQDLNELKARLNNEVRQAYTQANISLGEERLESWFRAAKKILVPYSEELYKKLKNKPIATMFWSAYDYSALADFDENTREPLCAFIDSLIRDIENDEFEWSWEQPIIEKSKNQKNVLLRKAFIVHGHDIATQQKTARFLEQIGFEAIILSEKPSKGMTIIEKLEHYIDADGFGVVLYTPDDEGSAKNVKDYKPRARQNVVFEHGWLIGALGRKKVIQVVTDHTIELPNDISGVVYLSDKGWELDFINEIHAMGYDVDFNLLRK